MDALEEESFALSFSSASDAEFDAVVGYLEDIIMDDEFQLLQRNFMDKYYLEFEDTEENKLTYTPIFNEYISLVEKYIEEQLLQRIPGFNMAAFTTTLQHHKDEVAGDIFDMLLTFTDFLAFKEMFLDYRAVHVPTFSSAFAMSEARFQARALSGPSFWLFSHIGKRRPRTGLKQWLSGDFVVQIIFCVSFPEQSAALGPTSSQ
ncbi:ADP-ribosylation factor-like protein 2-binding protein isoform X1 [Macaca fascicularis]|uniref:ADP-ribosylation factor-like protein 2-binding protein n=1 Tax=Macaca mulatta TaxID=9544 RepID=A0A5F7ZZK3_MACMU|nr:ADP-ribosylation factor-like protein 2-binding protein isoform X1 [Macaca fascicularis]